MNYRVKLPIFEGPLDLLLHLIEENKIDIYNIPIAIITQQYLDYLDKAREIDLDLTSEFIVMACTLLAIKAQMLLPQPVVEPETEEEGPDPREELVKRLLEYKKYQEKVKTFEQLAAEQAKCFPRQINEKALLEKFPPPNPIGSITWQDLVAVFEKVLIQKKGHTKPISLPKEEITIQKQLNYILTQLSQNPQGLSFYQLINQAVSKEEVIVTFLALLELVRLKQILLKQKKLFDDLYLYLLHSEEESFHADTFS